MHLQFFEGFVVELFTNLDLEKIADEKTILEWKKSKIQMLKLLQNKIK